MSRLAELLREYAERESGYIYGGEVAILREAATALDAAAVVVRAFSAESEDWNDGTYALWRKDDLINALVALRAALGGTQE